MVRHSEKHLIIILHPSSLSHNHLNHISTIYEIYTQIIENILIKVALRLRGIQCKHYTDLMVKGELNPKIKFALFKRTLKIPEQVIFQFLIPLLRF